MDIYRDPDFTGYVLPFGIRGWWPLTEEQWWLATKCVVRELNRLMGPGQYGKSRIDEAAVQNQIQADAAALIGALRVDPCKMFSGVNWGDRISWRAFACLAHWLASYEPNSRAWAVNDIASGNCRVWATKLTSFGFPPVVLADEAYQSGISVMSSFCNVWWAATGTEIGQEHTSQHEQYCTRVVDNAFRAAGGREDHGQPTQPSYLTEPSVSETAGSGFKQSLKAGPDLPTTTTTTAKQGSSNLLGLVLSLGIFAGISVWLWKRTHKHGY